MPRFAPAALADLLPPASGGPFSPPGEVSRPALEDPRTGLMGIVAPATWEGVRPYDHGGQTIRCRRTREQIMSPGHLRTLRRLPITAGHPTGPGGEPAFLHALARWDGEGMPGCPAPPDGYVWVPTGHHLVGWGGDRDFTIERDGCELPGIAGSIFDERARRQIASGLRHTSLGHLSLLDFEAAGKHREPDGARTDFDCEMVLDPEDPRVALAIAEGSVRPDFRSMMGANHWAAAIALGRGLSMAAAEAVGLIDQVDPATEAWLAQHGADPRKVPRLFAMLRKGDIHGTSGTGVVLYGALWQDGPVDLRWCSEQAPPASGHYDSLDDFLAIHVAGHDGNGTELRFLDGRDPPARSAPRLGSLGLDSRRARDEDAAMKHKIKIPAGLAALAPAMPPAVGASIAAADAAGDLELDLPALLALLQSVLGMVVEKAGAATTAEAAGATAALDAKRMKAELDELRPRAEVGGRLLREQEIERAARAGFGGAAFLAAAEAIRAGKAAAEVDALSPELAAAKDAPAVRRAALAAALGDAAPKSQEAVDAVYALEVKRAAEAGRSGRAAGDADPDPGLAPDGRPRQFGGADAGGNKSPAGGNAPQDPPADSRWLAL